MPDLRSNLLSVAKMTDRGFQVTFFKDKAVVVNPKTKETLLTAVRNQNLYYVEERLEENCRSVQWTCLKEWHERFGHLNENDLKDIIRNKKVTGVNFNTNVKLQVCETCIKGKHAQAPYNRSTTNSSELLELIHTDVCGPMRVSSLGGSRYFLTFIDDKSR